MKKHLMFLMVLLGSFAVLLAPGSAAAWARGGPPPWAGRGDQGDQGNGHGRKERGEHRGRKDRRENRGRHEGWQRDRHGRYRFDDHERRAVFAYFRRHRDDRDFRQRWGYQNDQGDNDQGDEDRGYYPPVAYGYVIAPRYRPECRPLPPGLVEELPPPPYGFRYFFFGGNVVLVDNGYRVQDFIHIGLNFGG